MTMHGIWTVEQKEFTDVAMSLSQRTRPPSTIVKVCRRERLIQRLQTGMARKIVLVRAPPGFGKSYLLANAYQELPQAGYRTAWLTPASRYASEAEFALEVARACNVDIQNGEEHISTAIEDRLANEIGARPEPTVIIIDGCDEIGPTCVAMIDRLIDRLPDRLKFILSSRHPLTYPRLSDLILRGAILELRWSDLVFNDLEAAELLGPSMQSLPFDQVMTFSLGWPAILRLAAVSAGDNRDGAAIDKVLQGVDLTMRRYVLSVVLPALDSVVVDCFRASGFLELVNLGLVTEFSQTTSAGAIQKDVLQETEPLLSQMTGHPGWYRVHPAIQAIFKQDFLRLPRAERVALHMQASRWFASNDYLERAVHHSVETGDYSFAKEGIREAGGVRIFLRSGFPALRRLLSELPTPVILQSSALQLCQAVVFGKQGQLESARALVEEVKASLNIADERIDVEREDVMHIDSLIRVYEDTMCQPESVAELKNETRNLSPRDLWRIGWVANHLCIVHTTLGDFVAAESEALKALTCYREQGV